MSLKNGILKLSIHNICILLFLGSLIISPIVLILYIGLLFLTYRKGIIGAIESLIIVTFRGILSTAVSANVGSFSVIKLVLIFLLSLYIIYNSLEINKIIRFRLIILSSLIFCVYSITASFITGSYPISSTFKIISFFITFVSIINGAYKTRNKMDWLRYLYNWLTVLMVISFFLIPFKQFRIINDNFQGVFNHVNVMGIMGAIYISVLLIKKENSVSDNRFVINLLIIMTLIMQYYTASRTGMIISCICILINFILHISVKKIIYLSIPLFACLCIYTTNNTFCTSVNNEIYSFIYKGNQNDILASRRDLQKNNQIKYENNELLGSGFMMPFEKEKKDFSLNMNVVYEPGNLVWMLLGDTGQIGIFLFSIFIFLLVIGGKFKNIILIIASFGICFGEMIFFSVNNFSIIVYLILSIYLKITEGGDDN